MLARVRFGEKAAGAAERQDMLEDRSHAHPKAAVPGGLVGAFVWLVGLVAALPAAQARDFDYVAVNNAAQVAVADIVSGDVVERIPVGPLPRGATASLDGSTVAVVNQGDETINIIDTETNTVEETLAWKDLQERLAEARRAEGLDGHNLQGSDRELGQMVLSPDGQALYVARSYHGLLAYDRATGEVRGAGDLPGRLYGPHQGIVKLSPDGSTLFVPDFGNDGMTLLSAETLQLTGRLLGLTSHAFDVTPDGWTVVNVGIGDLLFADLETFTVERASLRVRYSHMASTTGTTEFTSVEAGESSRRFYTVRHEPRNGIDTLFVVAAEIPTGQVVAEGTVGTAATDGMSLSPDGRRLVVVVPGANELHVLDAATLATERVIKVAPTPRAYHQFVVSHGTSSPAPSISPQAPARETAQSEQDDERAGDAAARSSAATAVRNDDRRLVRRVQGLLNDLGYDAGPADGVYGSRRAATIRAFEREAGLQPTGDVPVVLMVRLARAAESGGGEARGALGDSAHDADRGSPAGLYCRDDGPHVLALRQADGDEMDVAISSWQGGMHHCGLSGTADPAPGGWRFADGGACAFLIAVDDDVLRLEVSDGADCRSYCGARARLDGLAWSSTHRQSGAPDSRLFTERERLANQRC